MRLVRARIKTVGRLLQRAKRNTRQAPLAVFLYTPVPQNRLIRIMSERDDYPGFAPELDAPIAYVQRIRYYYLALGYGAPYRWAHYAEVPFQPLTKPLSECRVALITTAAPYQPGKGEQGPGAPTTLPPNSTRSIPGTAASTTICGFPISRSTVPIPPPRTATPGFRCRKYGAARRRAGSARSHLAFTVCRPTAATAQRSSRTAPSSWRAAVPTVPTPPFSSPIDRCATRPCVWPPGIWKRTASLLS